METSGENLCVYGLGECPVMVIMGDKMKQMEQRSKVLPQDPGAAAVSQMIQRSFSAYDRSTFQARISP